MGLETAQYRSRALGSIRFHNYPVERSYLALDSVDGMLECLSWTRIPLSKITYCYFPSPSPQEVPYCFYCSTGWPSAGFFLTHVRTLTGNS